MARKTKRDYVSRNIYRTPSGQYWNASTGKRVTARRGRASAASSDRAKARWKENGHFAGRKPVKVKSDFRPRKRKKHEGSPGEIEFEADALYDPSINFALSAQDVEDWSNAAQSDNWHFNVHEINGVEAG